MDLELLTFNDCFDNESLPDEIEGKKITFSKRSKIQYDIFSKIFGKSPYRGIIHEILLGIKLRKDIRSKKRDFFAIFTVFQRMHPALSVALFAKKKRRVLYLMDPTIAIYDESSDVSSETKWNMCMLKKYDIIFTTRFIKEAMLKKGYGDYVRRIEEVSFPMITDFQYEAQKTENDKITLLFCGTLLPDIRSPEYFAKIISKLDSRFKIRFIGSRCNSVIKSMNIKTDAEIEALGMVDYETAQQAMADADILINIGNSVPVHMPSKTLEYINTGKPIVNFYKFDDCPTLHYTKRYHLCLNLSERNDDIDSVTKEFIDFCINSKGKKSDREWIFENYKECTPEYIAKQISDACADLLK